MITQSLMEEESQLQAAGTRYPRSIPAERLRQFEGYMAEIFAALGLDLALPATRDTPHRFMQALLDATAGHEADPKLLPVSQTECHGGPDCRISQVVEGPIQLVSLCEHHALPVFGRVYVGYIAHEHIIGRSTLVHLVHLYGRRFTVEERIGREIADSLEAMLRPHGVAVYIEAWQLCAQVRGIRDAPPITRVACWRGNYDGNDMLRAEFLRLCQPATAAG